MTDKALRLEDFPDFLQSLEFDRTSDDAEVLLLTCIDFRYLHLAVKYMEDAGYSGKYDHVIIAGTELGPLVDFPPDPRLHWQQFFLEHLALAKERHEINRVVILGHMDCGAYRKFGVLPEHPTREEELAAHKCQADKLEALIKRFHCELEVDKCLLSLEQSAEVPLKLHRFV